MYHVYTPTVVKYMYVPNGGASDLGVAGYAQDGSVAGCRRGVTPRYRYRVQGTARYRDTGNRYRVQG